MSERPLPHADDTPPLWKMRVLCVLYALKILSPPGDPRQPLWRARLVIALFVVAWFILPAGMRRADNRLILLGGPVLIASGLGAVVWRGEFAEQSRRIREGFWFEKPVEHYRRGAILWGGTAILIGIVMTSSAVRTAFAQ